MSQKSENLKYYIQSVYVKLLTTTSLYQIPLKRNILSIIGGVSIKKKLDIYREDFGICISHHIMFQKVYAYEMYFFFQNKCDTFFRMFL